MKQRNGFVSNSSSSSFVVLLPDNFVEKTDWNEVMKTYFNDSYYDENEFEYRYGVKPTPELFKKQVELFIENKSCWDEYEKDLNNEPSMSIVNELIPREYIIGSIDSGPDSGEMVLSNKEDILKILNEE